MAFDQINKFTIRCQEDYLKSAVNYSKQMAILDCMIIY